MLGCELSFRLVLAASLGRSFSLWQCCCTGRITGIFWPQTLFFCASHSRCPGNLSCLFPVFLVPGPPLISSPRSSTLTLEAKNFSIWGSRLAGRRCLITSCWWLTGCILFGFPLTWTSHSAVLTVHLVLCILNEEELTWASPLLLSSCRVWIGFSWLPLLATPGQLHTGASGGVRLEPEPSSAKGK